MHWYSCKTFVCSYKVYLLCIGILVKHLFVVIKFTAMHWYSCKTFVCSYKVYLLCIGILVKHLFVVIKFTCYALVFL